MAGKKWRGWAEREGHIHTGMEGLDPASSSLQSQISALASLERRDRNTGHVSARTLLRDRRVMELPTASQEEQELQTSQGSVGAAGRDAGPGAGILSGPRWLCWSPWLQGHQRAENPIPSLQGPGTAGEGGDYSSPQGLRLPGEERMFPILPSHQGWIFPSLGPAGTSLKQRGQRKPRPSSAQQRDLGCLLGNLFH